MPTRSAFYGLSLRLARTLLAYCAAAGTVGLCFSILLLIGSWSEPLKPHTLHARLVSFVVVSAFVGFSAFWLAVLPFSLIKLAIWRARFTSWVYDAIAGGLTGALMIPIVLESGNGERTLATYIDGGLLFVGSGTAAGLAYRACYAWLALVPKARARGPIADAITSIRPSRWILAAAILTSGLASWDLTLTDPHRSSPRAISISIGEPIALFLTRHHIPDRRREDDVPFSVDLDRLTDASPLFFEKSWTVETIIEGGVSVHLPPAIAFSLGQTAGRIEDVTIHVGDYRATFAEVTATAGSLVAEMLAKGWHADRPIERPVRPSDLAGSFGRRDIVAALVSPGGTKVQVTITDGQIEAADSDAGRRDFALTVDMNRDHSRSEANFYARRLFTFGNINHDLPLRAWIEEPDWSPQAHGMVRVTPSYGQPSEWGMPPKPAARP